MSPLLAMAVAVAFPMPLLAPVIDHENTSSHGDLQVLLHKMLRGSEKGIPSRHAKTHCVFIIIKISSIMSIIDFSVHLVFAINCPTLNTELDDAIRKFSKASKSKIFLSLLLVQYFP